MFSSSVIETLYDNHNGLYRDTMLNLQDLAYQKMFQTTYKM